MLSINREKTKKILHITSATNMIVSCLHTKNFCSKKAFSINLLHYTYAGIYLVGTQNTYISTPKRFTAIFNKSLTVGKLKSYDTGREHGKY